MFSHRFPHTKRIISSSSLSVRYCVDKQSMVIRFLMSATAWLSINHHCTVSIQCSAVNCKRDSSAPHGGVSHYRWRRVKKTWMHQDLKSRARYCNSSTDWSELNSLARLGKRNYEGMLQRMFCVLHSNMLFCLQGTLPLKELTICNLQQNCNHSQPQEFAFQINGKFQHVRNPPTRCWQCSLGLCNRHSSTFSGCI